MSTFSYSDALSELPPTASIWEGVDTFAKMIASAYVKDGPQRSYLWVIPSSEGNHGKVVLSEDAEDAEDASWILMDPRPLPRNLPVEKLAAWLSMRLRMAPILDPAA